MGAFPATLWGEIINWKGASPYDNLTILRDANTYRVDLPSALSLANRVRRVCSRKSVDYRKMSVDYR